MLLSVRENLKNKVVFGIVIFVMLIMVVGGVGSVNLASIGGDSVASVGGEKISAIELDRAVQRRMNQLQQQGADLNSEFAQPEAIRQQVLPQLLQRKALVAQGLSGMIGASEEVLNSQIRSQEAFQVDGKFDIQTFRRLLQQSGYTPATYKEALAEDYVISQQTLGLGQSGFVTSSEINLIASIINEKRKFYALTIAKDSVAKTVSVTDEEISAYYQQNAGQFTIPDQVSVDYIDVSIADLAKDIPVSEEEIKAEYESQLASFKGNTEAEVAHILLADANNTPEKISEVQQKLDAGDTFENVAKAYSDDLGSKDLGGNLGVLIEGSYPDAFEAKVAELKEGDVSKPVETEFGTHFIKVVTKKEVLPPTFEEQKQSIAQSLKRIQAEQFYVDLISDLEEATYGDKDLAPIAASLNLTVKTTDLFNKTSGTGIATNASVRNAAFSDDVLVNDRNSLLIELSNEQTVVLRKKEFKESHTNPLDNVKDQITTTLESQKIEAALKLIVADLKSKIQSGEKAESLASDEALTFKQHELVDRTNTDVGFAVSRAAFDAPASPKSESVTFTDAINSNGDMVLIGVQEVVAGSLEGLSEQEISSLKSQLMQTNAASELGAYQSSVFAQFDIEQDNQ